MEQFFNFVTFSDSGCWLWGGPTCSNGRYGRVTKVGVRSVVMAHRMAFAMFNGVPKPGEVICHTCDNGLCVNPSHLFSGTMKDNVDDMVRKGRASGIFDSSQAQTGEQNGNAKLTKEKVLAIRDYHQRTKCSYRELKIHFGLLSKGHAHAIATGKLWK